MNKKVLFGSVLVGASILIASPLVAFGITYAISKLKNNDQVKVINQKLATSANQELLDALVHVKVNYTKDVSLISTTLISDLKASDFEIVNLVKQKNFEIIFKKGVLKAKFNPLGNEEPQIDTFKSLYINPTILGNISLNYVAMYRKNGKIWAVAQRSSNYFGKFIGSASDNLNDIVVRKPLFELKSQTVIFKDVAKNYFKNKQVLDLTKFFQPSFTTASNSKPSLINGEFISDGFAYKIIEAKRIFANSNQDDDFARNNFSLTIAVRSVNDSQLAIQSYNVKVKSNFNDSQIKLSNLVSNNKLDDPTTQINSNWKNKLPTSLTLKKHFKPEIILNTSGEDILFRTITDLTLPTIANSTITIGGVRFKRIGFKRFVSKIISSNNGSLFSVEPTGFAELEIKHKIDDKFLFKYTSAGKKTNEINLDNIENGSDVDIATLNRILAIKFDDVYNIKVDGMLNSFLFTNNLIDDLEKFINDNPIIKPQVRNGVLKTASQLESGDLVFDPMIWFPIDIEKRKRFDDFDFKITKIDKDNISNGGKSVPIFYEVFSKLNPSIHKKFSLTISDHLISLNQFQANQIKLVKLAPKISQLGIKAKIIDKRPREYFSTVVADLNKHFQFPQINISGEIINNKFTFSILGIDSIDDQLGIVNLKIRATNKVDLNVVVEYLVPLTIFLSDLRVANNILQEVANLKVKPIFSPNAKRTKDSILPSDVLVDEIIFLPSDVQKIKAISPNIRFKFKDLNYHDNTGILTGKVVFEFLDSKNLISMGNVLEQNFDILGFNSNFLIHQKEVKDAIESLIAPKLKPKISVKTLPTQIQLVDFVNYIYPPNDELQVEKRISFAYINIINVDDKNGRLDLKVKVSKGKDEALYSEEIDLIITGLGTFKSELNKISQAKPPIIFKTGQEENTILPSNIDGNESKFALDLASISKITSIVPSKIKFRFDTKLGISTFNDNIGVASLSIILFIQDDEHGTRIESKSYIQDFGEGNKAFTNNELLVDKILKDFNPLQDIKEVAGTKALRSPEALTTFDFQPFEQKGMELMIPVQSQDDIANGIFEVKIKVTLGEISKESPPFKIPGFLTNNASIKLANMKKPVPTFILANYPGKTQNQIKTSQIKINDFSLNFINKIDKDYDVNNVRHTISINQRIAKKGEIILAVKLAKGSEVTITYQVIIKGFKIE